MKPLSECRLYAFVDAACLHDRAPEAVAQQLCDGGADLIQLRAKHSTLDEVRRMAESILPVTRRANVGLVINDHFSIAQELGAEVCHLGQEDFFDAGLTHVTEIHRMKSKDQRSMSNVQCPRTEIRIGLSTHAPEQGRRAIAAGADYIAIGPVYPTGTKPGAKAVTLEYVKWAAANVAIPWFAIGGINLENLDHVLEAGARRICVVSAILDAADVAGACAAFRSRLG